MSLPPASSPRSPRSRQNQRQNHLRKRPWYYRTELTPGVFTDGQPHANLKLTLHLLSKARIAGSSCLDIGTQEAAVPTMLMKAGAKSCVAYDRVNLLERVELVQKAHAVHFDYRGGQAFDVFARDIRGHAAFPFDVAVNSGVLYHLFDPMRGLALTRGLVRDGGILVVETAVIASKDFAMHFNARGRFFPGSHYFQISIPLLDYLLRYMRLMPIDMVYNAVDEHKDGFDLVRMAVACRATPHPVATPEDAWMKSSNRIGHDFRDCLNWSLLKSENADVPYDGANPKLARRADGSVDLAASHAKTRGIEPHMFTFGLDANLADWREI